MITREQYHFSQNNRNHERWPHFYHRHHLLWLAVALLVLIYLVYGIYSGIRFDRNSYQMSNQSSDAQALISAHRPISILMMGTDTGALGRHTRGRTDTMILNTVNPQTQRMMLTSIPRDAPARYNNTLTKVNSVYTLGGANQAARYVQNWLGVPVNYYVLINMGGLTRVIDKLGGVEVNPPLSFKYGAADVKKHDPVVLNGKQALDYCRMRHQDPLGDYGRQLRQRQVLFQIFNRMTRIHNWLLHPGMANALSDNLKTNLSARDLVTLAAFYRAADRHHVSDHLQGETKVIDGSDFEVIPDNEKQSKARLINNSLK